IRSGLVDVVQQGEQVLLRPRITASPGAIAVLDVLGNTPAFDRALEAVQGLRELPVHLPFGDPVQVIPIDTLLCVNEPPAAPSDRPLARQGKLRPVTL